MIGKTKHFIFLTVAIFAVVLSFMSCQDNGVTISREGKAVSRIVVSSNAN